MSSTSTRRRAAAVGCTALLATSAAVQPAAASSMSFSKSSGRVASAEWLEVGTLPNVAGNIHFGSMQVEELGRGRANIYGGVVDLQCEEGYIPPNPGGGHGVFHGEPLPGKCQHVGFRSIQGGTATFTMDRRLAKATLTGQLAVFGHDGPLGNPAVSMTWTGVGPTTTSESSGSFSDGTTTYSYRYAFSGRQATVGGRIGPMVFDDHPAEYSSAQMGSYRESSRSRTR